MRTWLIALGATLLSSAACAAPTVVPLNRVRLTSSQVLQKAPQETPLRPTQGSDSG